MTQVNFTYQFGITRRPTGTELDCKQTKIPMQGYIRNMPDKPPDKLIGLLMVMPKLKNWHNNADSQGLFYEEIPLYNPLITVSRGGGGEVEIKFAFSGLISGLEFFLWHTGRAWGGTIRVSWPEVYAGQNYTDTIIYDVSMTEKQFSLLMNM